MSKIKTVIWIIILASLYILFVIYSPFLNASNRNNIIVSENTVLHYKNNKWSFIYINEFDKIDFVNTYVYDYENNFIEKVNLKYSEKWLKKAGFKYVDYDNFAFAYSGFKNVKLLSYKIEDLNEIDTILLKDFIKKYKKQTLDESFFIDKIEIDLDSDNEIETIYEISNMSASNLSFESFSMIVIYDNNEFEVLETTMIDELSTLSINNSRIYEIIDIDGDGLFEIITANYPYSESFETKYSLYQKKYDQYELIVTNREGE